MIGDHLCNVGKVSSEEVNLGGHPRLGLVGLVVKNYLLELT